jgi:hypothetical protein
MDLALLGFDCLNEAVTPSLRLRHRDILNVSMGLIESFACMCVWTKVTHYQVGHDVLARPGSNLVQLF